MTDKNEPPDKSIKKNITIKLKNHINTPIVSINKVIQSNQKTVNKIKLKPQYVKEINTIEDNHENIIEDNDDTSKRPDVKIRLFENKHYYDYQVVKMSLHQFVKDKKVYEFLNDVVIDMNKIIYLSYHFLHIHFLRLIDSKLPIPNEITQKLLYKIFCSVSLFEGKMTPPDITPIDDKYKKNKTEKQIKKREKDIIENQTLLDTYNCFMSIIPKDFKFPNRDKKCNLINNAILTMLTAINNHMTLNFRKRLYNYIKMKYTDYKKVDNTKKPTTTPVKGSIAGRCFFIVDHILGIRTIINNYDSIYNTIENMNIIDKYKQELQNPKQESIHNNLSIFIPFYLKMNTLFIEEEDKTFTLFPLSASYIPSYIKICKTSLADLIALKNNTSIDKTKTSDNNWSSWFYIDMFNNPNKKFGSEITTDGYGVNITLKKIKPNFILPYNETDSIPIKIKKINEYNETHKPIKPSNKFKKPSNDREQTEIINNTEWLSYDNHIGLDPGRRYLFISYDDDGKKQCLSRNEYYRYLGNTKRQKSINARKDYLATLDVNLNGYSFKVNNLANYKTNLKYILERLEPITNEYKKNYYRKSKFTSYVKKQIALERIKNILVNGKPKPKKRTKKDKKLKYTEQQLIYKKQRKQLKIEQRKLEKLEKLNTYNKKYKESIDKAKEKIKNTNEKKILIGYGNGSCNAPGLKGSPTPVKYLFDYLSKQKNIKVVKVNESYTTKMCSSCCEETEQGYKDEKIRNPNNKKEYAFVESICYGLRCCKNKICSITWKRDLNAAINIHLLLKTEHRGDKRPLYLCNPMFSKTEPTTGVIAQRIIPSK